MQQQNRLKGNMVKSYSIEHLQVDTMSGATCKSDEFEKSDKRRKFWHATDKSKNLPYFLIEVFSPLWILWNSIIFLVVAYD